MTRVRDKWSSNDRTRLIDSLAVFKRLPFGSFFVTWASRLSMSAYKGCLDARCSRAPLDQRMQVGCGQPPAGYARAFEPDEQSTWMRLLAAECRWFEMHHAPGSADAFDSDAHSVFASQARRVLGVMVSISSYKPKAGIKLRLDPRYMVRIAQNRDMKMNELTVTLGLQYAFRQTRRHFPLRVSRERLSRNRRRRRRSRRSPSRRWRPQERPSR